MMRRILTILLVVLRSAVLPFSGSIRAEVTGFGLKAGLSYANIHGRDVYEQRVQNGFRRGGVPDLRPRIFVLPSSRRSCSS